MRKLYSMTKQFSILFLWRGLDYLKIPGIRGEFIHTIRLYFRCAGKHSIIFIRIYTATIIDIFAINIFRSDIFKQIARLTFKQIAELFKQII